MSLAPKLRPSALQSFPGIAHIDGTSRVQTLSREHDPWIWEVLRTIQQLGGQPILANTSFNTRGKPLLNSARAALELMDSYVDLPGVVIEDWLFTSGPKPS